MKNSKHIESGKVAIKRRGWIDTAEYSARLRSAMVDPEQRAVLLTDFRDSDQQGDLSLPPTRHGFGRIHHFTLVSGSGWVNNPLPAYPASQHIASESVLGDVTALVFQTAGCNWRCWYCYVPFEDLTARRGRMVTTSEMVDEYFALEEPPPIIDLSGGQPDLVPEWSLWMVDALDAQAHSTQRQRAAERASNTGTAYRRVGNSVATRSITSLTS